MEATCRTPTLCEFADVHLKVSRRFIGRNRDQEVHPDDMRRTPLEFEVLKPSKGCSADFLLDLIHGLPCKGRGTERSRYQPHLRDRASVDEAPISRELLHHKLFLRQGLMAGQRKGSVPFLGSTPSLRRDCFVPQHGAL